MKAKTCIMAGILSLLLLTSCGQAADSTAAGSTSAQTRKSTSDMFSDRDFDASYNENTSTKISLKGSNAECSSDTVSISGSTITIKDEGTYIISGTLDDGTVVIDADKTDKIQLVLNNASINSSTSAAIYAAQADKVFVTLASDSKNTLSNGGEFQALDESNIDAAVFSKDDLTFNGDGELTVNSPAGHGIVTKDDLVFTGGKYNISAKTQALSGKQSVRIADGSFKVTSGTDGLHSEDTDDASLGFVYIEGGSYDITSGGDGISASNYVKIHDGSFNIEAGGGSESVSSNKLVTGSEAVSMKGIKSAGDLLISGGSFSIDSADDALHSNSDLTVNGGTVKISTGDDGLHADGTTKITNGSIDISNSYEGIEGQNIEISGGTISLTASDDGLNAAGGNDQSGTEGFGGFQRDSFDAASDDKITISGGTIRINASGDGIDSNGDLSITGGTTYVAGPTNSGNGALDYNGDANISGGTIIAAGASGMAQNFGTSSSQCAMLVSVSGSENDDITLKDSSGNELLSWTAEKAFSCVVISCPDIKQGETYTVTAGNSSQEITMDGTIYGSGGMSTGGMAPGGMGPGRMP